MQNWLTTEVILGALVVTSYTSMGLLSLWAATSPRHWFMRVLVVLGTLALLLMVPACEPVLVFAIQAVVIGSTVWFWRRKTGTTVKPTSERSLPRYSLLDFLWGITATSVVMAMAVRMVTHLPPLNLEAWTTIVVNGFASGIAVLVGAWLVVSKNKLVAWSVAMLLCIVTTALLIKLDWFGVFYGNNFFNWSWPPDPNTWQMWTGMFAEQDVRWIHALFWMYTLPTAVLMSSMLVLLFQLGLPRWSIKGQNVGSLLARRRGFLAVVFAAIVLLVGALPAFVLLKLLRPAPIPVVTLPDPNGYDDLAAAGRMIEQGSPMLNTAVEPQSTEELAAEVAKFAPAYNRIRLGLSRDCQAKPWMTNGKSLQNGFQLQLQNIQNLRAASRALWREGELALRQKRYQDAAVLSLENYKLSQAAARGGLLVDYLIGLAIEGIGQSTLYPAIAHSDDQTCVEMITALELFEELREPLDEVVIRDRIWSENSDGWSGHLVVLMSDWTGQADSTYRQIYDSLGRYRALNHLLIAEVALRRHELAQGVRPKTLKQLVPEFLPSIPIDPFDAAGGPLRCVDVDGVTMAYSIGLDREDDSGRSSLSDDLVAWYGDGDIRLDVALAVEDPQQFAADSDDESDAPTEDSPETVIEME